MTSSPPAVWNNASSIAADVAPNFTLSNASVASGTSVIALANKRVFLGTTAGTLVGFDNADTLVGSAAPTAILTLSGLNPFNELGWDAKTDTLWPGYGSSSYLFLSASMLTSASTDKAFFSVSGAILPVPFAYDGSGDRAFAAHTNSVIAFNGVSAASGTVSAASFTLYGGPGALFEADSLLVDKGSLYAAGRLIPSGQVIVAVWRNIASVSAPKAPDFTLGKASGLVAIPSNLTIAGDVLVVCAPPTVLVWSGASALTGETTPLAQINTVSGAGDTNMKAVLDPATDRLYVLTGGTGVNGVSIFGKATSAPTLVTTITKGITGATAFALLK